MTETMQEEIQAAILDALEKAAQGTIVSIDDDGYTIDFRDVAYYRKDAAEAAAVAVMKIIEPYLFHSGFGPEEQLGG